MLSQLHSILDEAGVKVAKVKLSRKAKEDPGKSTVGLAATQEEAEAVGRLYNQYFRHDDDDDADAPLDEGDLLAVGLNEAIPGDLGVTVEQSMTTEQLGQSLGLRNCRPLQFMSLHHKAGVTAWDQLRTFQTHPLPDIIQPLSLHWHQLAGVHSIVSNVFSEQPLPDSMHGILVADEVGLGKTAQTIAFLAFLNQVIMTQMRNEPVPPILRKLPYLGASDKIPSGPHLIITPGTLRNQWLQELKTMLLPQSVNIFFYDSSRLGNEEFWVSDSPFNKSVQSMHNRIILTTHSSLVNEYSFTFNKKPKSTLPWKLPSRKNPPPKSLFDLQFLTVTVDEAHEFQNLGVKHLAVLAAYAQARIRLALTATPLLTSTKDLSSLGRLVGIPHFFSDAALEEMKTDASDVRKAKKFDDDGAILHRVLVKAVRQIQRDYGKCLLRRTTDSKNHLGQTLLDLPPHKDIMGNVELTDREKKIINRLAEEAKANVISANEGGVFVTKSFYMEYRSALTFAPEDPDDPLPVFTSIEEWEKVQSTKMTVTAQVAAYYLQRDDILDVTFEGKKPNFPDLPPLLPGVQPTRTRRILIYMEFPSVAPLLQNILLLYSVKSLRIDGSMSFRQRDIIVAEFILSGNIRVFIFSSVGSAGLNLSIADMIIYFDQPWSRQNERQICGRAHRQPQRKVVQTIHILANDSSDVLMNSMAARKEEMFDAFVKKDLGHELLALLKGETLADGTEYELEEVRDGSEEDAHQTRVNKKRNHRTVKPRASASSMDVSGRSDHSDGKELDSDAPPKKKHAGQSALRQSSGNVQAMDVSEKEDSWKEEQLASSKNLPEVMDVSEKEDSRKEKQLMSSRNLHKHLSVEDLSIDEAAFHPRPATLQPTGSTIPSDSEGLSKGAVPDTDNHGYSQSEPEDLFGGRDSDSAPKPSSMMDQQHGCVGHPRSSSNLTSSALGLPYPLSDDDQQPSAHQQLESLRGSHPGASPFRPSTQDQYPSSEEEPPSPSPLPPPPRKKNPHNQKDMTFSTPQERRQDLISVSTSLPVKNTSSSTLGSLQQRGVQQRDGRASVPSDKHRASDSKGKAPSSLLSTSASSSHAHPTPARPYSQPPSAASSHRRVPRTNSSVLDEERPVPRSTGPPAHRQPSIVDRSSEPPREDVLTRWINTKSNGSKSAKKS
ncbi:hypothetical protein D9758_005658 [Tetrapyrgos nigripes]|uniref:Uncharacterized protein n=1 Tax=Tetrapyrgos nigripes TaxID=182062 RepID=A0A8H5GJF6_9AGAR|nr:hypothetical protein D9758_005658 [Tetrapyrgos nigripes]